MAVSRHGGKIVDADDLDAASWIEGQHGLGDLIEHALGVVASRDRTGVWPLCRATSDNLM